MKTELKIDPYSEISCYKIEIKLNIKPDLVLKRKII
jgi:hypothetical protein